MKRICLLALVSSAAAMAQSFVAVPITSAFIENPVIDRERKFIHFQIRNVGSKPITAYMSAAVFAGSDGKDEMCNAGGADMIDWSDPRPGTDFVMGMRRHWIQPQESLRGERYFGACRGLGDAAANIRPELRAVMFDDGSGEGDPKLMKFLLWSRQQERNERVKWVGRFSGLRQATDLYAAASALYRDLADAKNQAERDPEIAAVSSGVRGARQKLQDIAFRISIDAKSHKKLEELPQAEWLITDLEQRTARLVRGAGTEDVETR